MKKTKKLKSILLSSLFVFCSVLTIQAQQKTIKGVVTDQADGLTLPGVNIIIKGTAIGVSSDFEGAYSLDVTQTDAVLVFSYLGYVTKEIPVGANDTVNVALVEDMSSLDEVVIVGYGARKKSDITGSVSTVKSEEINAFPVLDAQQALQGRAAGVVVQSNNGGEPGTPISVTIRGNTSIGASSAALVVVDGFVGAAYPQAADIESVEVLKDASATAIYGSRGANGVILVTTKKGKKGKMTIEFNTNYTLQSTSNRLDLLDANQFNTYQTAINPAYQRGAVNTDWQDLIYTTGHVANHQLSFSGGSDNINYYVSGNYFDQKGVVINSGFERFSFLSNVDAQINDKLKLGFNAFGSRDNKDGVSTQANSGGRGSGDVISIAYRFAPDLGVLDANGQNTFNSVGDDIDNPFAVATERVDETKTDRYRANFYGEYEVLDNLTFKTTFGFSTRNENRGIFAPSTLLTTAGDQGGIAEVASLNNTNLLNENYLTYKKEIGKGDFTALLGYSYQKDRTQRFTAGAQGFVTNSVSYFNLGSGAVQSIPTSNLSEFEIQSQFGRLNYDYDNRYLLTLTGRRDGASNFSKNNKYAFFPSGAIGWKVSNEAFLSDSEFLSNLKLRYSYGVTGNPSIAPFQSLASFAPIYSAVGDQTVNAIVPNQLSNPDLKWETSYQSNFGVDLGLLDNRISLSVDLYSINTEDLILGDRSVPEYVGFLNNESLKNIGEITNKGLEISLTTRNVVTEDFSWTTDFNWSKNKNEITKLIDGQDIFLGSAPGHFLQDETHILREGEAVGQFFGYEYRGVYQGGALPAGTATFSGAVAGDELFEDLDESGDITTADRKIIGDPNQDWTFGFNNTFRYKDFDLGVFLQGGIGRISSRFVYDGSYVRLKNIALGYNLPKSLTNKLGVDQLRLALSGQNLFTFTDYPGADPEVSYRSGGSQNSNVNQGFDYGNYPNIESVSFSVNLKF